MVSAPAEETDMNISMDGDDSTCSEAFSTMLSSPPRAPRIRSRASGNSFEGHPSRLFDDDDEGGMRSSGTLRPLDLNVELSGEIGNSRSNAGSLTPRRGKSQGRLELKQRKRHAEKYIRRDLSFEEADDDNHTQVSPIDMLQSPGSPSLGSKSPYGVAAATSKSPCYRTIDGRTVQSKNPFSPMYTEDSRNVVTKPAPLADSISFPVSLEDSNGSYQGNNRAPLLRHRLQKRDTFLDPTTFQCESSDSGPFTRDGYPDKNGRYSFTGSPIREMEFDPSDSASRSNLDMPIISHKVRRRTKMDDAAAAASNEAPQFFSRRKPPQLHVNTMSTDTSDDISKDSWYGHNPTDDVSPTDVFSFPAFSDSPPTPTPQTPSKPGRHYQRRTKTRYTPVRQPTVPQTPMPGRRTRARSFDRDDECSDDGGAVGRPQSRFHTDFDVIGELGNGSFGNVFKVLSRLDGCMYAIKVAHRPAKGQLDRDRMLKEVYALAALSDQADTATFHIVRYHQAWMEEHRLYIQTELCTTTLAAEMKQLVSLSVERRYKFLREMCLALEFIHKNGMVHLDIKPENIFVKNDQFKLGDFGLVSKVSAHDVEEGDSRYMSKELLSGDHQDLTKSDIFSLGITLYEVCLAGRQPLPTNGVEWQALRAADFSTLETLSETPGEMQRLIKTMMNPVYAERPSASDLLKQPQLLSPEQKALLAERNKVVQANLALAAQADRLKELPAIPKVPPRSTLVRANTWNGF